MTNNGGDCRCSPTMFTQFGSHRTSSPMVYKYWRGLHVIWGYEYEKDDHGQVASSYLACMWCLCALSARVDPPDIRPASVWSHLHANQHGQDIGHCHIMYTHALLSLNRPHRSRPIPLSPASVRGRAQFGIESMSNFDIAHWRRDGHVRFF